LDSSTTVSLVTDFRPTLWRDRAFWGINLTQFLGAFNDNLYKELVLLLCVDQAGPGGDDSSQAVAGAIFAVAFILFSGLAGLLADRNSKRTVIVLCKLVEILVMLAGMLAFGLNNIPGLMVVLFLMGTHSAFFGPPKYGILPELFRAEDLPRANGVILMTTFLAIIFGFAAAGWAKEFFGEHVWMACGVCVAIAALGTLTSLMIRPTPIAEPNLKFTPDALIIPRQTFRMLFADRKLFGVLLASSAFWLVGGVVYPPAINAMGKLQMQLSDTMTGVLAATTGAGIATGCVLAGILCRQRVKGWLVSLGATGMFVSLILLSLPGPRLGGTLLGLEGSAAVLIAVGLFAGLFTVPLQVYLQSQAPAEQKGRIIAAMNLLNWIGICLAAGIYGIANRVLVVQNGLPHTSVFAVAAALMLPIALFYRAPSLDLRKHEAQG